MTIERPALPADIVVLPGTDVAGEWERFGVFEALHHRMAICNPMQSGDLDDLIDALDPADGQAVLDLACGHSELLLRLAERHAIHGVGVDLSPWVLARAARSATERRLRGTLEWWLGNARDTPAGADRDVVTVLGASWIWHGFAGTARAAVARTRPGGMVALGDLQLRDGIDPAVVAETYGAVPTRDEQRRAFEDAGTEVVAELDPGDAGWDDYQRRIRVSAESYATLYPGEETERYRDEALQWQDDHDRDRELLGWTVWVARVR